MTFDYSKNEGDGKKKKENEGGESKQGQEKANKPRAAEKMNSSFHFLPPSYSSEPECSNEND